MVEESSLAGSFCLEQLAMPSEVREYFASLSPPNRNQFLWRTREGANFLATRRIRLLRIGASFQLSKHTRRRNVCCF